MSSKNAGTTGVVAIQVWVNVGSKDEDDRVAGITHFIEHLIFKGTEKLKGNAFASRIEPWEGASTPSPPSTTPSTTSSYPPGLSGRLRAPHGIRQESGLPEGEISRERKVVLEEIKMGRTTRSGKLFKSFSP
jgi:predicted Zn-dependent peptidase